MTFSVRHGKIHHAIKNGKPSISMGHLYHGELLNNQRVYGFFPMGYFMGFTPKWMVYDAKSIFIMRFPDYMGITIRMNHYIYQV
jgi:hypothetical protein